MTASGPIALPSRYLAHDATPLMYEGYGGANGPIALPGRESALVNGGPFEHPNYERPPTDGAFGPIAAFKAMFNWSDRVRIPAPPPPYAWDGILHVRQWVDHAIGYLHRGFPQTNNTDWTTNSVDPKSAVMSPLPHFRSWRSYSLYHAFRSDYLYSTYWVPEMGQHNPSKEKFLAQQGFTMVKPYFPRLTEWKLSPSYGSTTEVLK